MILHSSSFVILSVHFLFIIRLKHLFTNVCSFLVIWLVVFQVSQAYNNNNNNTFVLNIRILTSFDMLRFLLTGYVHIHVYVIKLIQYFRRLDRKLTVIFFHVRPASQPIPFEEMKVGGPTFASAAQGWCDERNIAQVERHSDA